MDKIQFSAPAFTPYSLPELFINLTFCIAASFLLRYLFVRKSIGLSGKFNIGTVIPILATVTFLVIMVVKSSLALSLGLVGALSVIRFRTPIKEPEELVYLFMAIALGLGYGAGQTVVTSIVFVVVCGMIVLWLSRQTADYVSEYDLLVEWKRADLKVGEIAEKLGRHVSAVEMTKHVSSDTEYAAYFKINLDRVSLVDAITTDLRQLDNGASCTFYEATPLQ